MSLGPHPNVMTMIAEERRTDLLFAVDQLRLLKLTRTNANRRPSWSDLPTSKTVAAVLALLAACERGS
jgi:hypothetical protein